MLFPTFIFQKNHQSWLSTAANLTYPEGVVKQAFWSRASTFPMPHHPLWCHNATKTWSQFLTLYLESRYTKPLWYRGMMLLREVADSLAYHHLRKYMLMNPVWHIHYTWGVVTMVVPQSSLGSYVARGRHVTIVDSNKSLNCSNCRALNKV